MFNIFKKREKEATPEVKPWTPPDELYSMTRDGLLLWLYSQPDDILTQVASFLAVEELKHAFIIDYRVRYSSYPVISGICDNLYCILHEDEE